MCLITVGIAFYNEEKHISKAINSVLNQSYSEFQLILIDDGSSDDSLSIVNSFVDKRIQILADNKNLGLIYRLNQLIELTNSEYFVRMDADDLMFPDRLSIELNYLSNNREVDIVGSDAISIDKFDNIIGYRKGLNDFSTRSILKYGAFIHPTVMGKTSWFKKYQYLEGFNRAEDLELWLRSNQTSIFKYINQPTLFYREGSIDVKKYVLSGKTMIKIYKKYKVQFKNRFIYYGSIIKLILKVLLYRIFCLANKQHLLTAKRSQKLNSKDLLKYSLILKKTIELNCD